MWDRVTLKSNAKMELRVSYWLSFAVCLVAGLLGAARSGLSFSFSFGRHDSNLKNYVAQATGNPAILWTIVGVALLVVAFAVCFTVFVTGPVAVGSAGFFIRAPREDREFGNLFLAFSNGHYLRTVKTMFFVGLKTFLWSLLFVIPGIVAAYRYCMIPYLISEDPSLTTKDAFRLSNEMTYGEKADIFVLDLSFIGWNLLGALACGVGVLFVNPYYEATRAQLYYALSAKMRAKYSPAPSSN